MRTVTGLLAALIAASIASQAAAQQASDADPGGAGRANYSPFTAGSAPAIMLPATQGVPASPQAANAPKPEASAPVSRPSVPEGEKATKTVTVPRGRKPAAPAAVRPKNTEYVPGMALSGKADVIDGHSLSIGRHSVRLHGVEAPGLGQTCVSASGTAWPCGRKAQELLERVAGGENVTCTVVEPSGDGAAAYCTVRGIADLGSFLASSGFAVPNGHAGGKYAAAAAAARSAGAGIWGSRFEAPWKWRMRNR